MPKPRRRADPIPEVPLATTQDGRDAQLVALAYDLAAKQLREGTASAAVITHWLRHASKETEAKLRLMDYQVKLIEIRAKAIEQQATSEEVSRQAIEAMRSYQGLVDDEDL